MKDVRYLTAIPAVVIHFTLLLLVLGVLSACSSLREMFPAREEVFKPIPVTIGEPRIVGSDTVYVLESPEYELVAPMRELLPDARKALDQTVREYRRVFGDEPRKIVVELRPVSRDRVSEGWIPDTVEPADEPRRRRLHGWSPDARSRQARGRRALPRAGGRIRDLSRRARGPRISRSANGPSVVGRVPRDRVGVRPHAA